eukprot:369099_1
MTMLRKSIFIWSSDIFECIVLSLLLIFHTYKMHMVQQRGGGLVLCKIVQLKHVSYMIIICSLIIPLLTMSTKILDHYFNFLNLKLCHLVENINLILQLITHFGIHLFVAMRSILSSSDVKHPSIWFKIGLLLVSTDILLLMFPFLFTVLQTTHINGGCIVQSKSLLFIFWIMIQDSIIGIYSLCVFVIPLKTLISWEQKNTVNISGSRTTRGRIGSNSNIDTMPSNHNKDQDFTLQIIVQKVITCSTIMILSTMITLAIQAILGPELATFVPNPFVINSYCVVLQFADIETDNKSSFYTIIMGLIQCSCCIKPCLAKYHYPKVQKDVKIMHPVIPSNHSNMSSVITIATKLEMRDIPTVTISVPTITNSIPTIGDNIMPKLTPQSSVITEPSISPNVCMV